MGAAAFFVLKHLTISYHFAQITLTQIKIFCPGKHIHLYFTPTIFYPYHKETICMQFFKQTKTMITMGLLLLFMAAPAFAGQPRYVFYFIGDGLGAAQRQFSDFFLQEQLKTQGSKLVMNTFEVAGINTTYCADTLITDSAAAATALACGVKTNKGVIGKDVNGNNVKTLTEEARDHGMKTGLITTTRLTQCHAGCLCIP